MALTFGGAAGFSRALADPPIPQLAAPGAVTALGALLAVLRHGPVGTAVLVPAAGGLVLAGAAALAALVSPARSVPHVVR